MNHLHYPIDLYPVWNPTPSLHLQNLNITKVKIHVMMTCTKSLIKAKKRNTVEIWWKSNLDFTCKKKQKIKTMDNGVNKMNINRTNVNSISNTCDFAHIIRSIFAWKRCIIYCQCHDDRESLMNRKLCSDFIGKQSECNKCIFLFRISNLLLLLLFWTTAN